MPAKNKEPEQPEPADTRERSGARKVGIADSGYASSLQPDAGRERSGARKVDRDSGYASSLQPDAGSRAFRRSVRWIVTPAMPPAFNPMLEESVQALVRWIVTPAMPPAFNPMLEVSVPRSLWRLKIIIALSDHQQHGS